MRERNLLCYAVLWDEEKCFQSCTLASRECRAEASGSRFKVSLWHWELREVSSWRRCHSSACFSPWFSFARNWCDWFLATLWSKAWRRSVFTRHFSFLTSSVEISFTHGTSSFWRKLEIDWSFQLVSYLGFIVLWLRSFFPLPSLWRWSITSFAIRSVSPLS